MYNLLIKRKRINKMRFTFFTVAALLAAQQATAMDINDDNETTLVEIDESELTLA